MTDRAQLESLRDRLVAATGPDWILDDAIAQIVLGLPACGTAGPRRYTGDTDEALRWLVPSECPSWIVGKGKMRPDEPAYGAMFYSDDAGSHEVASGEHDANIAICVCLARVEYEIDKTEPT